MPILALNLRSSGSNTKSKNYPDFWSPSNEEPLDENYHFMGEYSFLFALPSDRVRCAAGASSARPPHRRHESSMADIGALTPLENRPPFAEHSRITLQGTPYGGPALSHPDDRDIVPEGEASRRDTGRRGAHKIAQNVKFHDQPSATPQTLICGINQGPPSLSVSGTFPHFRRLTGVQFAHSFKEFPMKTKFLFLIGVLVLGTLLAACGPSTVTLQPQPPQRTITVTGTGMVTLTPDIAYITIGVHSQDASASVAMTANNTSAQAVIAAIKAAGVADKDIQTTNFSISPQQQYDKNGNITGILYMVDNSVYVTVRDLTRLGGLLDSSVNAGANTINSISFDVADKTDALSQARLAAVANAKKQADELTGATGVTLGAVQTISYYDSTVPVAVQVPRAALEASGSNVPVQSGSMQITTTVTIVYEIK
jgi:uncharacterized protein YggE